MDWVPLWADCTAHERVMKYVLLQLLLLIWHLLRSLACAAQCCSAAHMLQDDAALDVCTAAGRHE